MSANVDFGQDVCGICGHAARQPQPLEAIHNMWGAVSKTPSGPLELYAGHKYHVVCLDALNEKDYLKFAPAKFYPGCLDGVVEKNYKKAFEEKQDGSCRVSERAERVLQRIESENSGIRAQLNGATGPAREELRGELYRALDQRDHEVETRSLKAMVCTALAVCVVVGGMVLYSAPK